MDVEAAKQIFTAGESLEQIGKPEQAIACYQQAVNLHPDHYFYHYKLGCLLQQQGEIEQATVCFERAIAFNSQDSWSYHALGEVSASQQQPERAIEYYQKAIELNPDFSWSHYNSARIFQQQNKLATAKTYYQKAVELDPDFFWSHYFLAGILTEFQEAESAIDHYQKVIQLDSQFFDAYYPLARHLHNQGRLEEAAAYYRRGIELNQADFQYYFHWAETLIQLNRFTAAISCCEAAIELQPNNLQAYFSLAQALTGQGLVAIADYRHLAAHKSPVFRVNLEIGLAKAWEQKREFAQSIKCCQRAIKIDPVAKISYQTLQHIPLESENIAQLITFYQEVSREANHFSPLLWGNLGDLLTQQSSITEAMDCYRHSCYQNAIAKAPQLAELDWQQNKQKLPDFLILGASKCGTTSLFYYLNRHPQVLLPHKKEIDFFNRNFDLRHGVLLSSLSSDL